MEAGRKGRLGQTKKGLQRIFFSNSMMHTKESHDNHEKYNVRGFSIPASVQYSFLHCVPSSLGQTLTPGGVVD